MPVSNQPTIILNDTPRYDFEYQWLPSKNMKWCLVTVIGAGGGGAGGESLPKGFQSSRESLNGGQGGQGMFCIFKFYPGLLDLKKPINIKVGQGGSGGEENNVGQQGETTNFGDWLRILGGAGGIYSEGNQYLVSQGRVLWQPIQGIKIVAYGQCGKSNITIGTTDKKTSTSQEPTTIVSAGGEGGRGGNGAHGRVVLSWEES